MKRLALEITKRAYSLAVGIFPFSWLVTRLNMIRNSGKKDRMLEIGPGGSRVKGFEAVDCWANWNADYIVDAAKPLPFADNTFEVIYASHVLEHVAWYQLEVTLREWVRVLAPGGALEVWVPNALKICQVFVDYENAGIDRTGEDGWYRYDEKHDPCLWAAGRIFTYGDGSGRVDHPNWHHSLFSPRFLKQLFSEVGLTNVEEMPRSRVRGYDHGWINLGVCGYKPSN